MARMTLNFGVRATWNTNPVNQQHLFARPAGSFLQLSHQISQPLDQVLQTSVRGLFPSTPLLVWQPRVAAAYEVRAGTVIHAGFGVFNDIIPAQIADLALHADLCGRHWRAGRRHWDCARGEWQRGGRNREC